MFLLIDLSRLINSSYRSKPLEMPSKMWHFIDNKFDRNLSIYVSTFCALQLRELGSPLSGRKQQLQSPLILVAEVLSLPASSHHALRSTLDNKSQFDCNAPICGDAVPIFFLFAALFIALAPLKSRPLTLHLSLTPGGKNMLISASLWLCTAGLLFLSPEAKQRFLLLEPNLKNAVNLRNGKKGGVSV